MNTETLAPERAQSVRYGEVAWLSASLILLSVVYYPTARWIFDAWMNDRFYSHGALVALVCVWLFSQSWGEWKAAPRSYSGLGVPLIVLGLLMVMAGTISDVMTLSGISLVMAVCGIILVCRGNQAFKVVSFPVLYFLFAVPVISAASDATGRVLTPMMEFAAAVTAGIADLIGLHPIKSGTIIQLPGYTMEVVVPCSGMASVVGLMALAALLAHLSGMRLPRGVLLVLSAIPVALTANVIRLTLTALLGVTCGAKIASGFLHEASGIFTFLIGAAILASFPRGKREEQ